MLDYQKAVALITFRSQRTASWAAGQAGKFTMSQLVMQNYEPAQYFSAIRVLDCLVTPTKRLWHAPAAQ